MGRKSREKKERRSAIIHPSGDKQNVASREVNKILLPEEFTKKFPTETLVVNPMNPDIPENQKVVVDMEYRFGSDLIAFVRFKGAAIHIGKASDKKCAFQIAVLQTDRESPWRAKANFMTDPIYIETDDLQMALDAMIETIQRDGDGLKFQVQDMIATALRKAKIDKAMGRKVEMPWFVQSVDEAHKTMSLGVKGAKK